MNVSRAGFLKVCTLALVSAGVDARLLEGFSSSVTRTGAAGQSGGLRLQDATAELFREHLHTSFRLHSERPSIRRSIAVENARAHLVLAEVSERRLTRNVAQFSLIFHAPGTVIPDGIHTLEHAALGRFELFIVPVGAPTARRTVYQACFSRHVVESDTRSGTSPAGNLDGRPSWRT